MKLKVINMAKKEKDKKKIVPFKTVKVVKPKPFKTVDKKTIKSKVKSNSKTKAKEQIKPFKTVEKKQIKKFKTVKTVKPKSFKKIETKDEKDLKRLKKLEVEQKKKEKLKKSIAKEKDKRKKKSLSKKAKAKEKAKAKKTTKKTTKAQKEKKPRKKREKVPVQFEFRGKLLSIELSNIIREIRSKLVILGCFFSYNEIIERSYKYVEYMAFYINEPDVKYSCTRKFASVIKDYFIPDSNEFMHNDILDFIQRKNASYKTPEYYVIDLKGNITKYETYVELHEAVSSEVSKLWNIAEEYHIDSPELVPSPMIGVLGFSESSFEFIVADFKSSTISQIPIYNLPNIDKYIQLYA